MRPWPFLRQILVGVLAIVLLSGCVVRVVYNQLDWLALWYVEEYFDLDAGQEEQARMMIERTLDWHRTTQLPRYAVLARTVLDGASPPVAPQFVADRYAEVVVLWDDLLRQVVPDFALLLQSLSDEQVDEMFAELAEENRELAKDYSGASREERRAKQDKAIIRAFRRFTGRLTSEQEALIGRNTARYHDLSADWLLRRAAWQAEFRILMVGRKSEPLFVEKLTALMLDPNQFDGPGYRKLVVENQEASFSLVAQLVDSLSVRQSDHLRKTLTTYASDFDILMRGKTGQPRQ